MELLGVQDVFVGILDFGPEAARTRLFQSLAAVPSLTPDAYRPRQLQRTIRGQAGVQRFFTAAGRGFCLYSVIGSMGNRVPLTARANEFLGDYPGRRTVSLSLPPVTAPYLAAVALLGAAGVAKAMRPGETANALAAAGHPVGRAVGSRRRRGRSGPGGCGPPGPRCAHRRPGGRDVRVVRRLHRASPCARGWALTSCGCFGRPDSPPTIAHAMLDAGAAASAVWWAAAWPTGYGFDQLARLFFHQPWHGGPLVLVGAVVAGLAYLVWTDPMPAARRS